MMRRTYIQPIYLLIFFFTCICFFQAIEGDHLEEEKEDLEEHPPITTKDVLDTIAWSTTSECFDELFKGEKKIPLKIFSAYSKVGIEANKYAVTWGRGIKDHDDVRRELCYHLGVITSSIDDKDIESIGEHGVDEETKDFLLRKQGHVLRSMHILNECRTYNHNANQSSRAPFIIFITLNLGIIFLLIHKKISNEDKEGNKAIEAEEEEKIVG